MTTQEAGSVPVESALAGEHILDDHGDEAVLPTPAVPGLKKRSRQAGEAPTTPADGARVPITLRFCPSCGCRLDAGTCAVHGVPLALTPPGLEGGRRPMRPAKCLARMVGWARSRCASACIAAAALLVVAATVAALVAARADVGRLETAEQAARTRISGLAEQLTAAGTTLNAMSRRVSDLEAARNAVPDTAAVAERVQRSVFTVVTEEGEGSGWAVAPNKVVTNFHVVADNWVNDRADVSLRQDDRTWQGKIVETSPADDLAVIEVDGPFTALDRAPAKAKVGDSVLVVGSPLGLGGTVASGIVSAFRTEEGVEYLQFSAPVSPGSSGGPVVDSSGQVIGVAVAKYAGSGAEGLSFAIPIGRACDALTAC